MNRHRAWAGLAVCALLVAATGCTGDTDAPADPTAPATGTTSPTTAQSSQPAVPNTPSAEPGTPVSMTPPANDTNPSASGRAPAQKLDLSMGETANLAYFDVTVLEFAHGEDGVSAGWKVTVCYTRAHPDQNADGTTRISTDPWSVQVRDGEGDGGPPTWVTVGEFPADKGWSPEYPAEDLLKVGDCRTGWVAVRHDNPDLQWLAVRYSPSDFDDVVTWSTS